MKSKKRINRKFKILIIPLVSIISLFLIISLIMFPSVLQTVFPGLGQNKMNCGAIDDDKLSCGIINLGDYGGDIPGGEAETFGLYIDNKRDLGKDYFGVYKSLIKTIPLYQEFSSVNKQCGLEDNFVYYHNQDNYAYEKGKSKGAEGELLGVNERGTNDACGEDIFCYQLNSFHLANKYFQNQLIILSGTYSYPISGSHLRTPSVNYKTFGFCNMYSGLCIFDRSDINIPEGLGIADPKNPNKAYFTVSSITIHLKVGGFSEDEICIEDNIERCEDTTYYICKNNGWENKGEVDGKCGVNEIEIIPEIIPETPVEEDGDEVEDGDEPDTEPQNGNGTVTREPEEESKLFETLGFIGLLILVIVAIILIVIVVRRGRRR